MTLSFCTDLVTLELATPSVGSQAIVHGGKVFPFYIEHKSERDWEMHGKKGKGTRLILGCAAHGCPYEVHFCHKGASDIGTDKTARTVRLPSIAMLEFYRRVVGKDAEIIFRKTATHALAIFQKGYELSLIHISEPTRPY